MNDNARNDAQEVLHSPEGPGREISRGRRIVALLLTVLIVFVVGLTGLELFARYFMSVSDVPYVFWDPVVGLRREPNQSGRNISGGYINARYNFNAQGWNYPDDYTTTKPVGTQRICIVGDSQIEARQVDVDKNMAVVAQGRMNRPDRPVQWYPFGCSGLGTGQEYAIIRHYTLDYEPDLVILLYVQNDPFDCSPYIMPVESFIPNYYLDEENRLRFAPATHWKPVWWRRISSKSALVRYFVIQKLVLRRIQYWGEAGRADVRLGGLPLRDEVESVQYRHLPGLAGMSMEARQEKTWLLTEKLFETARDECRRRGAVFAVAFRGWAAEIDASLEDTPFEVAPREKDPYCLGERVSEMGREIIGPMCERLGIPYLDLTEPLRAEVERTGESHRFPDDNHYSELGHRAAGQALAKWAEELLEKQAAQFAD